MNCGWCGATEGFEETSLPERYRCPGCCWFRWPRPEFKIQEVGPVPPIDPEHEMNHFKPVLDRIEQHVTPGKLYDVGCGLGGLVGEASRRGWQAHGNDCRPELKQPVREAFGFTPHMMDFLKLPLAQTRLEAVVFHHGIEHLPHPMDALCHAYDALVEGGVVYMAHPHVTDIEAQGNTSVSPGAHNYEWHADEFMTGLDWSVWELLHHDRGGDSQYWLLRVR